jgi:hypothetical protein
MIMATNEQPNQGNRNAFQSAGIGMPRPTGSSAGTTGLIDTLREQTTSRLTAQKDRAADGLGSITEAIRKTGEQLRGSNAALADYADSGAAQLERWAANLRDRELPELLEDVKGFARRRPAVFLGIGVAVGVAAARLMKSSGQSVSGMRRPAGFSTTNAAALGESLSNRTGFGSGRSTAGGDSAVDIAADRSGSRPSSRENPRSSSQG